MPTLPVRVHSSIDSTNEEARRLVSSGEFGPLWIRSGEQTGGRGRLGRGWVSKPGNVYSTLLINIDAPMAVVPQIGFVCALAVYDAVRSLLTDQADDVRLKWPNDCLVRGRKLAGILAEHLGALPGCVALGCGINVGHSPAETRYPTASLSDFGSRATVDEAFELYATAMERWLAIWKHGLNFAGVKDVWLSRAIGVGETVTVTQERQTLSGQFSGLAEDGALLLSDGGSMMRVYSGDVQFPSLEALRRPEV